MRVCGGGGRFFGEAANRFYERAGFQRRESNVYR
ncbi:hypothetical protein ABH926_005920 [Catenulispora sp. GP43]